MFALPWLTTVENGDKYPLELICTVLLSSVCNATNRVAPLVINLLCLFFSLCSLNPNKGKKIIPKDHLEMSFNLRARKPEKKICI